MKVYRLKLKPNSHVPRWDYYDGGVVVAENEAEARRIAHEKLNGDETRFNLVTGESLPYGQNNGIWQNIKHSWCSEIDLTRKGLVISSFNAG